MWCGSADARCFRPFSCFSWLLPSASRCPADRRCYMGKNAASDPREWTKCNSFLTDATMHGSRNHGTTAPGLPTIGLLLDATPVRLLLYPPNKHRADRHSGGPLPGTRRPSACDRKDPHPTLSLEGEGLRGCLGQMSRALQPPKAAPKDAQELAKQLVRSKTLTRYQAQEGRRCGGARKVTRLRADVDPALSLQARRVERRSCFSFAQEWLKSLAAQVGSAPGSSRLRESRFKGLMNQHALLQRVGLLLVALAAARSSSAAETAKRAERPNILWLVSEDNDPLLGCYGDSLARTPTIDRLAAQGVLYERCFAQPVCAPSRFTLITGMYAASCGPANHMRAEGKIPPWLTGFPALLRKAGYYTSNNAKTDYNAPLKLAEIWDESSPSSHWRNGPTRDNRSSACSIMRSRTRAFCFQPKIGPPPSRSMQRRSMQRGFAFRRTSPTRRKSAPTGFGITATSRCSTARSRPG